MKESTKSGYVAGGCLLFTGILLLIVSWSNGNLNSTILYLSGVFDLLGLLCLWKPDSVGQVVLHWLNNLNNDRKSSNRQYQKNTKNSHQVNAGGNVKIITNVHSPKYYRKRRFDK